MRSFFRWSISRSILDINESLSNKTYINGLLDMTCPFCTMDSSRIILENDHAIAIYDGFPVSPGHLLIIPKKHIASFFEANDQEQFAIFKLLAEARELALKEHTPDGFNVGINDGVTAGQTVMHLHLHLIPRYAGDSPDPRGGVRWIFPEKADYWTNRK